MLTLHYQNINQIPGSYGSVLTTVQYMQPVQPRFYRQTYLASTPSVKTVSDVGIFMENKKMHKLPAFKPHLSGFNRDLAPIYCSNKVE